jgi:ANTAR domain
MTASDRVDALVAEAAARRGGPVGLPDVCTAAVAALPVSGAGISVLSRAMARHPLYGTDGVSERLEELQLTLGEGPCVDAYLTVSAVLSPDVRAHEARERWPMFAAAAEEAGARAVFAFPLRTGAISPGVLDLYSTTPGRLEAREASDARAFARAATLVLLDTEPSAPDTAPRRDATNSRLEVAGGYRAEIDQASGMLTEQLAIGVEEALIRLRAYAYLRGRPLDEVAADIVSRRLRFAPDTDDSRTDPDPYPERGDPWHGGGRTDDDT